MQWLHKDSFSGHLYVTLPIAFTSFCICAVSSTGAQGKSACSVPSNQNTQIILSNMEGSQDVYCIAVCF